MLLVIEYGTQVYLLYVFEVGEKILQLLLVD